VTSYGSVEEPRDDRSAIALGMAWVSRVTTIAMEMAAPGLVGLWIDRRLGTAPWLTILGAAAGFGLGIWELVRLAETTNRSRLDRDGQDK